MTLFELVSKLIALLQDEVGSRSILFDDLLRLRSAVRFLELPEERVPRLRYIGSTLNSMTSSLTDEQLSQHPWPEVKRLYEAAVNGDRKPPKDDSLANRMARVSALKMAVSKFAGCTLTISVQSALMQEIITRLESVEDSASFSRSSG